MIEKMKFISLRCDLKHLDETLLKTVGSGYISLVEASEICNEDNHGYVYEVANPYQEYLTSLNTLAHSIGIKLEAKQKDYKSYNETEIDALIKELEVKVDLSVKEDNIKLTEDDRKALDELSNLDFELLHKTNYIYIGLGRISKDSYKKLSLMTDLDFDTVILHSNNQYHWICFVCSKDDVTKTFKTLNDLFIERIRIPDIDIKKVVADYREKVIDVYSYCFYCNHMRKLYRYVAILGTKYIISGFVASKNVEKFVHEFDGMDVDFRFKAPSDLPSIKPPTLLHNNAFFKPFESFVEMYSIPDYYDFDPTSILGFMYCLLFGIMFGDLGQGFVLFLAGYLLNKKKNNNLLAIISRVGLFSMFFGFLYGSVFGNEELLNPIHQSLFGVEHKLIHVMDQNFTMKLLTIAVVIGMVCILTAISLNIYKNYRKKKYVEILFDTNGLAGLVLYGFMFVNVFAVMVLQHSGFINKISLVLFVLLPLIAIYLKHPLENLLLKKQVTPHEGWFNYLLQAFFEVLEVLLSFISNTMSFLRVGGFVLSHAGMMLVVMTISEMIGSIGSIPVIIIGNIFVIGLEGLIVGIQTLRLQYYEMFSRYYAGGGKKFEIYTTEK